MPPKSRHVKKINLALQGGGSHGAYTWGVLDAFLADERIEIEGLSGTSAGSLNAAAVAFGLTTGDRETARKALENVWQKVSRVGMFYSPVKFMPWETMFNDEKDYEEAFSYAAFQSFTGAFSPYQFNPWNTNPLHKIIDETLDLDAVRSCKKLKIFMTATDVFTGHARIFKNDEITTDVILASSCLPFLFQAVMIGGRPYWDGGYIGNPALWPLFYKTETADICIVNINPIERHTVPKTAYAITNRLNEITFNSSLLAELRAIDFVQKLVNEGWLKEKYVGHFKNIRLHAIRADHDLAKYSIASKYQTDWEFLCHLRDMGKKAAQHWIKKNFDSLGKKGTVDIKDEFLDIFKKQVSRKKITG